MNSILLPVIYFTIFVNSISSFPTSSLFTKTVINEKLDEVIFDVIRENRNEIDVVQLPNHSSASSVKVGPVNLTAEMSFFDIFMKGLPTIRRTGDTTAMKLGSNGDIMITGKLALGVLDFNLKSKLNLLLFSKEYDLKGRIVHLDVDMAILYSRKSDLFKLKLLEINEINGLELKLKNPSFKNRFLNFIIDRTLSSFETIAKLSIENKLTQLLNETINRSKILRKLVQEL